MKKMPELTDVNSDQQNNGLEANLVIDRQTASRVGVTPQMLDNILKFGPVTVLKKPLKIEQIAQTLKFLGHKVSEAVAA